MSQFHRLSRALFLGAEEPRFRSSSWAAIGRNGSKKVAIGADCDGYCGLLRFEQGQRTWHLSIGTVQEGTASQVMVRVIHSMSSLHIRNSMLNYPITPEVASPPDNNLGHKLITKLSKKKIMRYHSSKAANCLRIAQGKCNLNIICYSEHGPTQKCDIFLAL